MLSGLYVLAAWLGIAMVTSIRRIRGRHPAIGVAMLAGGLALVASGLWLNQHFVPALLAALPPAQDGPYHDTYYVVAHGHYAILNGAMLLILSVAAFWLHYRAGRLTWQIARAALWLFFVAVGAQAILAFGVRPAALPMGGKAFVWTNLAQSISALVALLAVAATALCLLHTLWRSYLRRS